MAQRIPTLLQLPPTIDFRRSPQSAILLRRRLVFSVFILLLTCNECCWGQNILPEINSVANTMTAKTMIDVLPPNSTTQRLHIAGMYDLTHFPNWPERLIKFTVHLLNNKSDGWHDDVLMDAQLDGSMANDACDEFTAVREYLEVMQDQDNPPNAIFGCRCSGASMGVARLCAVQNVPILSLTSTSAKLSNKVEYPTFSRLSAPDDSTGQVGALIQMLRSFGWERISIIHTDTQFTNDIAMQLSDYWKGRNRGENLFVGEIGFQDTIKLNLTTDEVDPISVVRVLQAVHVENPEVNSRVIVLFAHHQHAFSILQIANKMGFQPDTIWVGTSEWIGHIPEETSWMPPVPGYLGITPYRNLTSPMYLDYLERLQEYERQNNLSVTENLFDHAADQFVDGLVALAMAFSAVPPDLRRDGWLISQEIRKLKFEGVSGPIAFTEQGDLKYPRFAVVTMRANGTEWTPVGFVTPQEAEIASDQVCWAYVGCVATVPDDKYPVKDALLPTWVWVVVASLFVLLVLFVQQRLTNRTVTDKLQKIEAELSSLENDDDAAKLRKGRLYKEIAGLLGQPTPEHWTDDHGLVEVKPTQQEYWDVLSQLQSTMNEGETCHLSRLSRIQNLGIWSYYVFRKNQLANKYKTDLNDAEILKERAVWHGTSSLNPDVIYSDQHDGFMMQLSQQGQWGRGIYFSERSGYSDPYSFKPLNEYSQSSQQDRELLLVKLLVGESILLDRNEDSWMADACKDLLTPPDNPSRIGLKFDTVEGEISDEAKTRIFVVYDNGRAYPEYLVRYYKGERDERRTPFQSLEEALLDKSLNGHEGEETRDSATGGTAAPEDDMQSVSTVTEKGCWQFLNDNEEWENFLDGHQIQIEQAYQQDSRGVVTFDHFPFTYAIDFTVNVQTNLDHPHRKSRQVRRIDVESRNTYD